MKTTRLLCTVTLCAVCFHASGDPPSLGIFEGHNDVGEVLHAGSTEFDASTKTYALTGSGENMWFAKDDFQFVWKKVSAKNVTLAADISLPGSGGENHRKAVLMIRQSLDTDAPYADIARHGDGLTSLQFRSEKGAVTHEVEASVSGPERLRIEKRGDLFYMWYGKPGQPLEFAGGSTRVVLHAPFYVGLGVCSHNKDLVQKADFESVELDLNPAAGSIKRYSTLETITVTSTDARVSYVAANHLKAPGWSEDGTFLIFSASGKTQRVPVTGGSAEDFASKTASKDKEGKMRLSPDGKQAAVLSNHKGVATLSVTTLADKNSTTIAMLPAGGALGPRPWSPDGKRIAFVSYQSVR
jgi:hypothetical protein